MLTRLLVTRDKGFAARHVLLRAHHHLDQPPPDLFHERQGAVEFGIVRQFQIGRLASAAFRLGHLATRRFAIRRLAGGFAARLELLARQRAIRPRVVGEFDDSALLKTFGASGMGVFPAAEWAHDDLLAHYAVKRLGHCEGVTENFFAIGTEKKVQRPLVQRLLQPAL